jgi:hypothetical protein
MFLGTRSRFMAGTVNCLRSALGAAILGAAVIGASVATGVAQEASPEASPIGSPVAAVTWIDQVSMESETAIDGDRASVGVVLGEIAEINVAEIEIRPYIVLQTDNQTDSTQNIALFSVPEGFDATTFAFPAREADLPEGVMAIGAFQVAPGEQAAAVFEGLAEGSYVIATDGGLGVAFAIVPTVDLEVPNIFETPEGTPDA